MRKQFLILSCALGLAYSALAATPATPAATSGACALLSSGELKSVQGEVLKNAIASERSPAGFSISQCYFGLAKASKSVTLTLTQKAKGANARDPRSFWKETFHGKPGKKVEREAEEGEHPAAKPQKVDGVGDEAYWSGNAVGGTLYVLKGPRMLSLSVGGGDAPKARIRKSKQLAQMVIKRL